MHKPKPDAVAILEARAAGLSLPKIRQMFGTSEHWVRKILYGDGQAYETDDTYSPEVELADFERRCKQHLADLRAAYGK